MVFSTSKANKKTCFSDSESFVNERLLKARKI